MSVIKNTFAFSGSKSGSTMAQEEEEEEEEAFLEIAQLHIQQKAE